MFSVYVPPTAKVIRRRTHGLKSHPKDWRSPGSNSRPLVYKANNLITTTMLIARAFFFLLMVLGTCFLVVLCCLFWCQSFGDVSPYVYLYYF